MYKVRKVHNVSDGKKIITYFEGKTERELINRLKPWLKEHKPKTFRGLMRCLKEEYNNNYKSKIYFYDY